MDFSLADEGEPMLLAKAVQELEALNAKGGTILQRLEAIEARLDQIASILNQTN